MQTNPRDKERTTAAHIGYMLARTRRMFKWEGLPDSIPERDMEVLLQTNGNVCVTECEGKLYALIGAPGGEPDPYYMPTIYTVANPALKMSKTLKIGTECVIVPSDSMYMGLLPLLTRYASAMTETELSIFIATINTRIIDLISAPDDRTKAAAEKFFQDIEDGRLGVIAENAFLDGVRAQPYGTASNVSGIKDLIEELQYQKGSMYTELGLRFSFNMKREAVNAAETVMNDDALFPLVDDMLQCRKEAAERINRLYGTDISVSLASAWRDNAAELEQEISTDREGNEQETPTEEPPTEETEERMGRDDEEKIE